jgi:hypothetical protein
MWERLDSQDVGSEAAIIQRMRNSSLVKRFCAENLPGLSMVPDPRIHDFVMSGRGASSRGRSVSVSTRGPVTSENAGVSSDEGRVSLPPDD